MLCSQKRTLESSIRAAALAVSTNQWGNGITETVAYHNVDFEVPYEILSSLFGERFVIPQMVYP